MHALDGLLGEGLGQITAPMGQSTIATAP